MPQFLIPLVASGLGVSSLVAEIIVDVGFIAASFGVQQLLGGGQQQASTPYENFTQNIRVGVSARGIIFGKARVGGQIFFEDSSGPSYYRALAISSDNITRVESYYLNGIEVFLDSQGKVTTPPYNYGGTKYAQLETNFGFSDQPSSPLLQAGFPGLWTAQHTASGIAYIVGKFDQPATPSLYTTIFQGQKPQMESLVLGRPVYDPRDVTQSYANPKSWKYSSNPALILMHCLSATNVYGKSRLFLAADTFVAVANKCDELITTKLGLSRPRYECGGEAKTDDAPADLLQKILDTFSGYFFQTSNGLIGLTCEDLETSSLTITKDMVTDIELTMGVGSLYATTTVKSKFTSEGHGFLWGNEEANEWINQQAKLAAGLDRIDVFDMPWVFRHDQTQRLMKKRYYRMNPSPPEGTPISIAMTIDFNGNELWGGRIFTYVDDDLGINAQYRIDPGGLRADPSFAKFTVKGTYINPESMRFNAATEEGAAPAPTPATSSGGLTTPSIVSVFTGNNGGIIQAICNWSNTVASGQGQDFQWRIAGGTWSPVVVTPAQRSFVITGLTPGSTYEFEVRTVDPQIGVSNWALQSFTATAAVGTTGNLVSLTAIGGVNSIALQGVQGNFPAAAFVQFAVMPRGVAVSWASPILITAGANNAAQTNYSAGAADYDIYARSIGINNDVSATSGPTAATVAQVTTTTGLSGSGNSNSGNGSDSNTGSTGPTATSNSPPSHPLYS